MWLNRSETVINATFQLLDIIQMLILIWNIVPLCLMCTISRELIQLSMQEVQGLNWQLYLLVQNLRPCLVVQNLIGLLHWVSPVGSSNQLSSKFVTMFTSSKFDWSCALGYSRTTQGGLMSMQRNWTPFNVEECFSQILRSLERSLSLFLFELYSRKHQISLRCSFGLKWLI